MLGLDLGHMAFNKWNFIWFGLAFKVVPFLLAHRKWLYNFIVIVLSNNLNVLLYVVWIIGMEAKQYEINILVVI
jgi:hypothetical protein